MAEVGLNIKISADVLQAVQALGGLNDNLVELATEGKGSVESVALALNDLRQAAKNAGNTTELALFNRAIRDLSIEAKNLRQVGLTDAIRDVAPAANSARGALTSLGLNAQQTRVAFLDSARAISGQGFTLRSLGSQLALLGPGGTIAAAAIYGLYEVLNKTTDAEKRAAEEAKKLKEELQNLKTGQQITDEATGSEAGNIARVRDLAAAITDTNRSYKERQNALIELRETNKAYFGDLTLEKATLKLITDRVNEYSQALVAEAVVKAQVEAIGKITSSLFDQIRALNALKEAREKADAEAAKPQAASSGNVAGGGADVLNNQAARAAVAAKDAYEKQAEAVFKLKDQIAHYKEDLATAIDLQLKFKPLKDPVATKDSIKSLEELLLEIERVKKELATPSKEPFFKQFAQSQDADIGELYKLKIAKAIADGNKIGTSESRKYALELAGLYSQELLKIRTPNLFSHIQGIVKVTPDDVSAVESKIEKAFGTKGLDIKVPLHIQQAIDNTGAFDRQDIAKIKAGFENDPGLAKLFVISVPEVQIAIGRAVINEQDLKKLKGTIEEVGKSVVVGGFADIGKALGDALSGAKNPLQAAIKSFTQVLGDGLIKIGEAMIEASTVVKVLQEALNNLFGNAVGGIVAGVAAVAAGELIRNVGAHAFAEGGIVTGPTLGLIGEAGPEAIFPLSKLNDFVKNTQGSGGSQHVTGEFTIRGNDLKLVLARANKNQSLV